MPKRQHHADLDLPSGERFGDSVGRLTADTHDRNGHALPDPAEDTPHRPRIAIPARVEGLQRLLGATIAENRNLTAHVRELEAELAGARRSSPSSAASCVAQCTMP